MPSDPSQLPLHPFAVALPELLDSVCAYHPNADTDLLSRAYVHAVEAHEGQVRKSGAPYFDHPSAVAKVITELRLDVVSVCAGLLHDVVEDTPETVADIEALFGAEVAFVVDGVTKLSKINFRSRQDREAENFRKLLVAMARDIRVLLVKLCDRVDNMRTLQYMKTDSQERIAKETLDIYAPLANRLGIHRFKTELEDLSFQYLDPEAFNAISRQAADSAPRRDKFTASTSALLRQLIDTHGFRGDVSGRSKHLYSMHRMQQAQRLDFDRIHELVTFRVEVQSVADCYGALGAIHSRYTPVPGRIKDHIALPKPNMYQALHTTVMGPNRERIEIQLCTTDMKQIADLGVAARWTYRDGLSGGADPELIQRFAWLRELVEVQQNVKDPAEFLESIKVDLFQDEVYAFTPKGDVRVFPRGSTAIDFAYSIHTEVGNHCAGCRINGVKAPASERLHNGDMVEILTDRDQTPQKDWLVLATTSKARNKIRTFLRTEQRERSANLGRELLQKEFLTQGLSLDRFLNNEPVVQDTLKKLSLSDATELFTAIGYGKLSPNTVLATVDTDDSQGNTRISLRQGRIEHFVRRMTRRDGQSLKVSEIDDILVRYARCCSPLPGDEIAGFITRGRGITVHRRTCAKALEADPERRVEVVWDSRVKSNRPVQVKVITDNRPGILAKLGLTFEDLHVNLSVVSCREMEDGRSQNVFTFRCEDLAKLQQVMRTLRRVSGVHQVDRL